MQENSPIKREFESCLVYKTESGENFIYDIYIVGEIENPANYIDAIHIIRYCTENDIIIIHLNSSGGDLFSALQFSSAIKSSKAKIYCNVEGLCVSAATLIFFASHYVSIEKHSVFLFHTYSANVSHKKSHELSAQLQHDIAWVKSILTDVYNFFLSKAEIDDILNGKDIWMNTDEVNRRYKKLKRTGK